MTLADCYSKYVHNRWPLWPVTPSNKLHTTHQQNGNSTAFNLSNHWHFKHFKYMVNTHNPRGGDPFLKGNFSRARGSRIGERDFFLRCVLSLSLSRDRCSLSLSLIFCFSLCFSRWWDLLLLRRLSERSFSRWRSRSRWCDRLLLRRRSWDPLRCLPFLVQF